VRPAGPPSGLRCAGSDVYVEVRSCVARYAAIEMRVNEKVRIVQFEFYGVHAEFVICKERSVVLTFCSLVFIERIRAFC